MSGFLKYPFLQPVNLDILRTDYFYSLEHQSLKQVEVNTIASSFAALSAVVQNAQRY